MPPQNSINGGNTTNSSNIGKKKWHSSSVANSSSNNGGSQGANSNGINYNKSHAYHHSYSNNHIPMMNSANNGNNVSMKKQANPSNGNGPSATSPSFSSYNSSSQYDLYKFDVTKLKNFKENSSSSVQLPLFINTTEAEFATASAQRYELNLKALRLDPESLAEQPVAQSSVHPVSYTHLDVYKRQGYRGWVIYRQFSGYTT